MNNTQLIGNLTKDVELRYNGENPSASFRIAVNGYGDHTDFIPVMVYGKDAENCNMYLRKGSKVGITGRIHTWTYEKDGQTFYPWNVTASRVEFLDRKEKTTDNDSKPQITADNGGKEKFSIDIFEPANDDIPF